MSANHLANIAGWRERGNGTPMKGAEVPDEIHTSAAMIIISESAENVAAVRSKLFGSERRCQRWQDVCHA